MAPRILALAFLGASAWTAAASGELSCAAGDQSCLGGGEVEEAALLQGLRSAGEQPQPIQKHEHEPQVPVAEAAVAEDVNKPQEPVAEDLSEPQEPLTGAVNEPGVQAGEGDLREHGEPAAMAQTDASREDAPCHQGYPCANGYVCLMPKLASGMVGGTGVCKPSGWGTACSYSCPGGLDCIIPPRPAGVVGGTGTCGRLVSCGAHKASSCELCGSSSGMCNGDCKWEKHMLDPLDIFGVGTCTKKTKK